MPWFTNVSNLAYKHTLNDLKIRVHWHIVSVKTCENVFGDFLTIIIIIIAINYIGILYYVCIV